MTNGHWWALIVGVVFLAGGLCALCLRRAWAMPMTGVRAAGPSLRSEVLAAAAILSLQPWAELIPANQFGVALCRLNLRIIGAASLPVRGCRLETVRGPTSGEWVRAPSAYDAAGAVLLLHGSGYIGGSPRTHRGFASHLSRDSGLPVFAARYRLAPEYCFPAAEDDAVSAYRWLLGQGLNPATIVVVGDSAGGHLAIALAIRARADGLPAPAALTLFGPLIDPSLRTSMADRRTRRNPLDPNTARRFLALYIGGHDIDDPRLSLLRASLAGLPAVQLHYGSLEVLRAEAELFGAAITDAGGSCQQHVWPHLVHGYWLFPQLVPEARESLRVAGEFIRLAVRASAREPQP